MPWAQYSRAGWRRPDPGPALSLELDTAWGSAESVGTHTAQLGAPTRGISLADPPLRASKWAPTLAPVHCHSHGNSYTNGTHIGAHTQHYKHASSRVHTQTRTLTLTNMRVHGHSKHTHRRTQFHRHTHIGVQPHIHSKNKTLPCALNPHVHVHIQTHLLLPSSSTPLPQAHHSWCLSPKS